MAWPWPVAWLTVVMAASAAGASPATAPDPVASGAETHAPALSLGGELRETVETYENDSFSTDPEADSTAFLQRYRLHADWHPAERLRIFTELQSAFENGRAGDADRNPLDLHQFFADAVLFHGPRSNGSGQAGGGGTLTLRAGRQELSYGSERLIGVRDGTNNRRAFDAVRLIRQGDDESSGGSAGDSGAGKDSGPVTGKHASRIDLFAGHPVEWDQGDFDDQSLDGTTLAGVYATFPLTRLPGLNLDLYWLVLDRDQTAFSQGSGREERHTLGSRFFGKTGSWDFNHEIMLQWGRFSGGDILAWSLATDHGFTLHDMSGKPRLGLKAAIASGDRDAGDRDLQTFNPLYPRGSYFTEASLLGPQNFMDLRPGLRLQPAETISLEIGADFYWRQNRADGIYRPSGSVIYPGNPGLPRFVGTDLSFTAEWVITPRLTLAGAATHFFAGPFLTRQGGTDVNYGSVWATWKF